MITDKYIQIATEVLAKCGTKDIWFPNVGEAVILGWAESFAESRLEGIDLLAGVERAYRKEPDGYRPLPASIIRHAQAAYFEALKELPEERRELMEEANHALQDMGYAPPVAHRYSRQIALGRDPGIDLTDEQKAALRARLEQRKALADAPRRNVIPLVTRYGQRDEGAS
ncbi:hypothetical protein [Nocardia sp. MW-W600-9]